MLCRTQQAAIMVHTRSGDILTSECKIWNLRLRMPNVLSIVDLVTFCTLFNLCFCLVAGLGYGVIKYGKQAYPLSLKRTPLSKPVPSRSWPIADDCLARPFGNYINKLSCKDITKPFDNCHSQTYCIFIVLRDRSLFMEGVGGWGKK